MSQADALARAWCEVTAAPDGPGAEDAWAALRRQLARAQVAPEAGFRDGLLRLAADARPPEELVHRLTRACGLGFGDPRLRWPRKVTALAARPGGAGAVAEDEDGRALWLDATSLLMRELPREAMESERPLARGLLPGGEPWLARERPDPFAPGGRRLRITRWEPAGAGAGQSWDLDTGPVVGDPALVAGLPHGPHVLFRGASGEVTLAGFEGERALPALARGFGRGVAGLPSGELLGPVPDDADALRLARVSVERGEAVAWGPTLHESARILVSLDGARVAVYRRDTRGASVQVLRVADWKPEMYAPLVEGFLGWSPEGVLYLGPSPTRHLGRWAPGDDGARRLGNQPPLGAMRYALLREDPPELLTLGGGAVALHDLVTREELAPRRDPVTIAVSDDGWARANRRTRQTWESSTGRRRAHVVLSDFVPWPLEGPDLGLEHGMPPFLAAVAPDGTRRVQVDLMPSPLVMASGAAPLTLLLRDRDGRYELREVDPATGATTSTALPPTFDTLHGGGLWVPGAQAWTLRGSPWEEDAPATLHLQIRRLPGGQVRKPTDADADDRDYLAHRIQHGHPALRNSPRVGPGRPWLWLPDEEETRAITPEGAVAMRLPHPPAAGGPLALSPTGARLARALSGRILVWEVASGELLGERPARGCADAVAFLGEGELLVATGDRAETWDLG